MRHKYMVWSTWILAFAPVLLVLFCLPILPEQVPMNWGLNDVIQYGPVWELVLITLLSPLIILLLRVLPSIDPRKKNYADFQTQYDSFGLFFTLFYLALVSLVLLETLRPGSVRMFRVVGVLVGLLFMALGNIVGKVKSNFFFGFRTPWALENSDVWNKTQRLGGLVFFFMGLGSLICALLLPEVLYFWVLMIGLALGVAFIFGMSWHWYRQSQADA